ncbi:porin [Sphingomonas montanisoli]|uniref:Porin n=1 Tax=Sphingomonas montanisoli TaxID=2606412 RepID=A0A5D9C3P3_9SPHN|nr:porin [Sphingomonas montanisoli]TZG26364.1 porin [Sphingomonas montanisoli]
MTIRGITARLVGAAAAASLFLLAPVSPALSKQPDAKVKIVRKRTNIGFFTPAASNPARAASLAQAGLDVDDAGFRFTPSGSGNRRAVTVAVRARNTKFAARSGASLSPTVTGLEPSAYSLGASVGWKRFALAGDVARVDGGLIAESREIADLGLSYSGNKWSTRLLFGAERASNDQTRIAGIDQSLSLDLGGSYSVTKNLEVTGGLRYKSQRERLDLGNDQRLDSQALYVGTAFRF